MDNSAITILDVGHGNASLIQENDVVVLVDTGMRANLRQHLEYYGITEVEAVIVSHSDADHIGGLIGMLAGGIKINKVLLNSDAIKKTQIWDDLVCALEAAREEGNLVVELGLINGPVEIPGFDKVSLEVAAPSLSLALHGVGYKTRDGNKITGNSMSAVVRVLHNGNPMALITGDMDDITLSEIVRLKADVTAKFLVFPHHGGKPGEGDVTKFTTALLNEVKPKGVLFSHGRDKFQNPNKDLVSAIQNFSAKIEMSCTQLSKGCSAKIPVAARSFDNALFSVGHAKNQCCAGSIRIPMASGEISEPTKSDHEEFILNFVPDAICRPRAATTP